MDLLNHLKLARCPHCSTSSPDIAMEQEFNTTNSENGHQRVWAFYVCQHCGGALIGSRRPNSRAALEIFPPPETVHESIPEKARVFLEQAIESLHVPAGSVMLSTSCIDAMLTDKGFKEGRLYKRITKAAKDHLIDEGMVDWARAIRLESKDRRQTEEDKMPDEHDAREMIDFARILGEYLFILPAKVKTGVEKASGL
mgnify:FL=1